MCAAISPKVGTAEGVRTPTPSIMWLHMFFYFKVDVLAAYLVATVN